MIIFKKSDVVQWRRTTVCLNVQGVAGSSPAVGTIFSCGTSYKNYKHSFIPISHLYWPASLE